MARYALNQPVRVSTTVRQANTDGTFTYVNAGTLTLLVQKPDATQQSYTSPVNDAVGFYHQDIPATDLTQTGHYTYTWTATGTGAGVSFGDFDVWDPLTEEIAPDTGYCTMEELKQRLGITDTADDLQIAVAVQAAARGIEKYTGRYFWKGTDTRTYVPDGVWLTHVDDLVSVTSLKTDSSGTGVFDVTWTLGTDFELALGERSYNVSASGEPWPYREIRVIGGGSKFFPFVWPLYRQDRIQITGTFGWPAVPALVKQAALQLAAEYFKLKDAPWGVAGFSEFGVIRVQAGSQLAGELDPYVDPRRKVGV